MFDPITNHVQAALARLLSRYVDADNLKNFITALVNPVQDIEGVLSDLNTLRMLSAATGKQLDNIGTIVGLARPPGATDAQYRNDLYAEIKINVSEGQPEQAIQTYQLFTAATLVILAEFFPAEVMIESDYLPPNQAAVDNLLQILNEVLPAGVRPMGIVTFDSMDAFAYDGSLPGVGYGSASDPTVGGMYPILFVRNTFFAYDGNDPTQAGYGTVLDPLVGGQYAS